MCKYGLIPKVLQTKNDCLEIKWLIDERALHKNIAIAERQEFFLVPHTTKKRIVDIVFSSYFNFVFPLLFVIVMDRYYVPREEQALLNQFGQEYLEFMKKVRRWI